MPNQPYDPLTDVNTQGDYMLPPKHRPDNLSYNQFTSQVEDLWDEAS
jgi:hypothetical protein